MYAPIEQSDVFIDPFRPGVMERLGLGPAELCSRNQRLVYARLTGFGQEGPYAPRAGHDINYISIAAALSLIGRQGEPPVFPANILGDFAGGGMLCALGVLLALIERQRSGRGQVIDAAMIDGSSYLASFVFAARSTIWAGARGTNLLDGGGMHVAARTLLQRSLRLTPHAGVVLAPFYEVYQTKDGKYMAVGALEPQFYALLLQGLGLADDASLPQQHDQEQWPELRRRFRDAFLSKTRDQWSEIFAPTDACVTPVLEMAEFGHHPHNAYRKATIVEPSGDTMPAPAPRLSRTPALVQPDGTQVVGRRPNPGEHTREVLLEYGVASALEIDKLVSDRVVECNPRASL